MNTGMIGLHSAPTTNNTSDVLMQHLQLLSYHARGFENMSCAFLLHVNEILTEMCPSCTESQEG